MYRCEVDDVDTMMRELQLMDQRLTWNKWRFRGQANSNWRLVPSLYRKKSGIKFPERFAEVSANTLENLLREHTELPDRLVTKNAAFVQALGQHYGLPTRLMDWSVSPLVAAYFAASEPTETGNGRFTVFAYDCEEQTIWTESPISFLPLGDAGNPNLRAQGGVLLDCGRSDLWDETASKPVESVADIEPAELRPLFMPAGAVLVRLDARADVAPELLKRLRDRGVSAKSLFPGYVGLVRQARMLANEYMRDRPAKEQALDELMEGMEQSEDS